jgi:hypothetical protein
MDDGLTIFGTSVELRAEGIGRQEHEKLNANSDLTTCDWTDEFCDCRDLGTIYSLITEEELCARHYQKRLAELPTVALEVGLKKPAAKVGFNQQRRECGESL